MKLLKCKFWRGEGARWVFYTLMIQIFHQCCTYRSFRLGNSPDVRLDTVLWNSKGWRRPLNYWKIHAQGKKIDLEAKLSRVIQCFERGHVLLLSNFSAVRKKKQITQLSHDYRPRLCCSALSRRSQDTNIHPLLNIATVLLRDYTCGKFIAENYIGGMLILISLLLSRIFFFILRF